MVLLVVAAALASFDAYRSARVMLSSIKQARSDMDNGIESVVVGDTSGGPPQLHAAVADAARAIAASNHPSMRLLGLLPVVGSNIRATRAVATAIEDSATAGLTLADAAGTLGWGNILVPSASSLGNVDLAKIEAATPKIDLMAAQLQAALAKLRAGGGGRLVGPVATGYRDLSVGLERRTALASDMRTVFHLLPTLLGGNGTRRYLVVVQSLAIPRATGGLITSVGVLTAEHGKLSMGTMSPASASMAAAAPSPDVPTDAPMMLRQARIDGLGKLQGVLLTDPVGLSDMLWMSGPTSGGKLTAETAVPTLERQLYLGSNASAAAHSRAAADTSVLRTFLTHRPSVEAFSIGMAQALSQRHLYIWMADPRSDGLLSQLGATGKFQPGSLTVGLSSPGSNRVGYYLTPVTTSMVTLDRAGSAAISDSVRFVNTAPSGPASLMLGKSPDVGVWSGTATIYLPPGASIGTLSTSPGGTPSPGKVGPWRVVNGRLKLKAGGIGTFGVDYRQTSAATRSGTTWTYRLVIVPQPSLAPMSVRISIKIPDGMKVASKANRLTDAHGTLTYAGDPSAPLTLWVSYR